jgi:hypothetical protein
MLAEQKNKTAKLFQFTATTSNPWDEVQFNFWKHKVTNMVLSAISKHSATMLKRMSTSYYFPQGTTTTSLLARGSSYVTRSC